MVPLAGRLWTAGLQMHFGEGLHYCIYGHYYYYYYYELADSIHWSLDGTPPLPPLHFYKLLMCIKPSSSASTLALVPANLICGRSSKLVEPKSSVSKVLYDS